METQEKIKNLKKSTYKKISVKDFENFKDIKAVIFDFDNTLYRDIDWVGYEDFVVENMKKIFSHLTEEEFNNMLKKHNYNADRVIEFFAELCVKELNSTKKFWPFIRDIKFDGDYSKVRLFPHEVLVELSKKYNLYILSNSSVPNIKYVAKQIKLDLSMFKKLFDNKFKEDDLTKARSMKDILKYTKLSPNQILMVGDSVFHDLLPAQKLGMQVMLIED